MLTLRSLFVCLATLLPLAAYAVDVPVRVIDGDTFVLGRSHVRLFGIDAPERNQTCDRTGKTWNCGRWAAQFLADTVTQGQLTCSEHSKDRYGRSVATCLIDGRDLGEIMVAAGAATAYRRYSDRYIHQEAKAKAAGLGVWSGQMTVPEVFRQSAADTPPATAQTCLIKGNISTSGRKIYHRPGQQDYDATRISPSKGEAWFCTEAEAQAAGFRPAQR